MAAHSNSNKSIGQYVLGPFTVTYHPLRDNPIYTRYSIEVMGKEVRAQISCPEETDGWIGYSKAVKDRVLNSIDLEGFRAHCLALERTVRPPNLITDARPPLMYYGRGPGRPPKANP